MLGWTDERVELLKKLWADGLSASQIAAELTGVTRNAVIGKVHRLGLSGRAKAPAPTTPRPKKVATHRPASDTHERSEPSVTSVGNAAVKLNVVPVARPQVEAQPKIYSLSDAPLVENAGILDLTEQTCKWPVGDPGDSSFHFCARRSETGIPYCGYHARVAYQPVSERRREKRAASY